MAAALRAACRSVLRAFRALSEGIRDWNLDRNCVSSSFLLGQLPPSVLDM